MGPVSRLKSRLSWIRLVSWPSSDGKLSAQQVEVEPQVSEVGEGAELGGDLAGQAGCC